MPTVTIDTSDTRLKQLCPCGTRAAIVGRVCSRGRVSTSAAEVQLASQLCANSLSYVPNLAHFVSTKRCEGQDVVLYGIISRADPGSSNPALH